MINTYYIEVSNTISSGRPPSSLGGAAPVAPWVGVPPSQLPQPTRLPVLVVFLSLHPPYPPAAGIRPSVLFIQSHH
ncbi:hypothetical protein RSOLAG1IB_09831 [Rhizoctonia solani AG-1 IB]|uniref:Uncharacterized protein n=1 Tax=Thanatephorus cucumeris (strain AG1-IB / isolate 7/3/14) TaxID=1108050 RepID=A0A0B7FY82_THACB|nr:hypothetical protein RSOLAG1IB_09831 [Rhizoctonia solani AG-1 IB]